MNRIFCIDLLWDIWLFPASRYHKQGCYEHSGTRALWHGGHHLGTFSRVVLLVHQVDLFSFFQITLRIISRMVVTVCNPTINGRVFLFLHILNSICCHLRFFKCSHSDWCKVESWGCFDLHFSDHKSL